MTVDFTSNTINACIPAAISFTNTTTNAISYSWDFGDGTISGFSNPVHTYILPGIYSVKLVACNSTGDCDSLTRTAYITILPVQFTRNVVICPGESYVVSTHTYTTSGTYTDVFTSTSGCDSIIITNLTIDVPSVSVTPLGPINICQGDSVVLSSSSGLSAWQWYRFNTPIQFATGATYAAKVYGQFWCVGYSGAQCPDSSNRVSVNVTCLPPVPIYARLSTDIYLDDILVFPNPGQGLFNVRSAAGQMEIYSYTGALIKKKQLDNGINSFDLSNYIDGIYMVTIRLNDKTFSRTLILSRN